MPIGHDDELSICPPDDHTFSRHASDCGDDHVFNELPGGRWQVGGFVSQYDFLDDGSSQGNHGAYANVTLLFLCRLVLGIVCGSVGFMGFNQ